MTNDEAKRHLEAAEKRIAELELQLEGAMGAVNMLDENRNNLLQENERLKAQVQKEGLSVREILFRGKRIDNGEWIEGQYVYLLNPKTENGQPIKHLIHDGTPFGVQIDPETLCEYTGLTDKNGRKVFEGDIVQYPIYQGKHRGTDLHTVVFESRLGSAYFGITMDDIETWYFCCSVPSKLMEVIGNIHDKKEA